ncbi:hypothetical protein EDF56_10665 [Novosphingobium sp. PhB165]|nr:hypothetical protein EDF56_10665 [Novosphingobium sp. PhB165]
MAEGRPFGRQGAMDDTAQPGMGMDDGVATGRNGDVMLVGAGAKQQDIAGFGLTPRRMKARRDSDSRNCVGVTTPHRIAVRQPYGLSQRGCENAQTVEAQPGIASVKPKRHPDQTAGGVRQFRAGHEAGVG